MEDNLIKLQSFLDINDHQFYNKIEELLSPYRNLLMTHIKKLYVSLNGTPFREQQSVRTQDSESKYRQRQRELISRNNLQLLYLTLNIEKLIKSKQTKVISTL